MPTFQKIKEESYILMPINHLRDNDLSLKARGLLSIMLSMPDGWSFSVEGLSELTKDGYTSIKSAIYELEEAGYLKRFRLRDKTGKFGDMKYQIISTPEKQHHREVI